MKIRIKFSKQGYMKFVGHLDIMRYFQKAMRRGKINIRYSEGFSPHQIMSFAAPLGVGITSNGEYLDIEVIDQDPPSFTSRTMTKSLNQVMVEGIQIISCRKLPDASKNAMSIVCAADYTLRFRERAMPDDLEMFFEKLSAFYSQDQIMITKKTKRSQRKLDLKPLIYHLERRGNAVFMQVSAGSGDNIKPELVMESFYESQNWEYPPFGFLIQREEVYGHDQAGNKIPLEEFGENIE